MTILIEGDVTKKDNLKNVHSSSHQTDDLLTSEVNLFILTQNLTQLGFAIIISTNSPKDMDPSPSWSASRSISMTSSSLSLAPRLVMMCLSSAGDIDPLPSLINKENVMYQSV